MKYLFGAISLLVIMILAGLLFIYSGMYNMSALSHHSKLTLWGINTLRDNSIRHHASNQNITMPNLSDSAMIKTGFAHYREMCVGCHGAPGVDQADLIVKGFYPRPPKLVRAAKDWTPEQLFWITKNGLKMSGMPAFGPTHTDDKIWAMVSFTRLLPTLTKEQYQTLDKNIKPGPVN
jgi:mono/diheme cytochrome c family protein